MLMHHESRRDINDFRRFLFIFSGLLQKVYIVKDFLFSFFIQISERIQGVFSDELRINIVDLQDLAHCQLRSGFDTDLIIVINNPVEFLFNLNYI